MFTEMLVSNGWRWEANLIGDSYEDGLTVASMLQRFGSSNVHIGPAFISNDSLIPHFGVGQGIYIHDVEMEVAGLYEDLENWDFGHPMK